MGIESGVIRAVLAGGVTLGVACTPVETPAKNTFHIVNSEKSTHQGWLWPLMSKTDGWKAKENNTSYKYRGRYCEGEYIPYPRSLGASCEGIIVEIEGEGKVNAGDILRCAEIPDAEELDCTLFDINPPLQEIKTIYPSGELE